MLATIAACGNDPGAGPTGVSREAEVLLVPSVPNHDVDMVFVIGNEASTLDWQTRMHAAFPAFLTGLTELPNIHIGAITPDLGTSAADGTHAATIPGSVGGCAADGANGNLQTYSALVTGSFISDITQPDGSHVTNYTGSLADAFTAITSAGSAGCGFQQTLGATVRALDNNPANAGFLRANANLAIVVLADEDDCSLAQSTLLDQNNTALGPFATFRCTRFGITCDQGGQTSAEMNAPGPKSGCHSNEQSDYLTPIATQVDMLKSLKADPRTVTIAAILGDLTPFAVELRVTNGGGNPISALAHSCEILDSNNQSEVANPSVRIAEFAGHFRRGFTRSICNDFTPTMLDLATQVGSMIGGTCLTAPIVEPPQCTVADETLAGTTTNIPPCPATGDCYTLATDSACPGQQLKLVLTRTTTPPADTVTSVRCLVP